MKFDRRSPKKKHVEKGVWKRDKKKQKIMEKSFGVFVGNRKHGGSNAKVKLPTVL